MVGTRIGKTSPGSYATGTGPHKAAQDGAPTCTCKELGKIRAIIPMLERRTNVSMQIVFPGGKRVSALYHGFTIETDQSPQSGGHGSAPEPFDLFLASIGTCAGLYVLNFCEARNIPVGDARLIVRPERDTETGLVGKITIDIQLPAEFPEHYVEAVKRAVQLCTVKKHLDNPPVFEVFTTSSALAGIEA